MVVMRVTLVDLEWEQAPEWQERAACRGHGDLFFPAEGLDRRTVNDAYVLCAAICGACPVFAACRAEVDRSRDRHGFHAGESPTLRIRRWRVERAGTVACERVA